MWARFLEGLCGSEYPHWEGWQVIIPSPFSSTPGTLGWAGRLTNLAVLSHNRNSSKHTSP